MLNDLKIFNTLTKQKEVFKPVNAPYVGMYVCGPTVYSDVHIGNMRTFLSFDVVYRYLQFSGYKVRYVRNITDVGHLVNDADDGEDKISQKAKLENLEPMEIVQMYSLGFHEVASELNLLPPSIEPSATGHIVEQINMTKHLLGKGLAYEVNGSVYFDVNKYDQSNNYGILSGRKIEELMASERVLDGQDEKRNKIDFALWKKAAPEHIMRWDSPWGEGFPGWHLECTVMSTKYLGESFDIHGGGMDLKFPHHECEIAQSVGAYGQAPAKYWMHTNMLTVNGQKMSKSLGNSFLPHELFTGNNPVLDEAYSPMTTRFFMLQSHYSSTLDFSNEALKASKKGYRKLMNGVKVLRELEYQHGEGVLINEKVVNQILQLCDNCHRAMNDDFNTALTIGHLFNLLKKINNLHTQNLKFPEIGEQVFNKMKSTFLTFTIDILGLKEEQPVVFNGLVNSMLGIYKEAKAKREFDKVDKIRADFKAHGLLIKDMKNEISWAYEE